MAVTDVLSIEENDAIDALEESVLATPKVPQDKKVLQR